MSEHVEEHVWGDGYRLIIEWSEPWNSWIGTVTKNGHHDGTIMRDTRDEVLEVARERRG